MRPLIYAKYGHMESYGERGPRPSGFDGIRRTPSGSQLRQSSLDRGLKALQSWGETSHLRPHEPERHHVSHHHDDDEDSRRHHFSHHHDRDHSIAHHRAHHNHPPRFETANAIRRDISAAKKHVTELVNNPGDVTRRLLSSMSGVFTGVSNGGEVQEDTRHNHPDGGTRASGRRRAERDVRALIAANEDLVQAHAQTVKKTEAEHLRLLQTAVGLEAAMKDSEDNLATLSSGFLALDKRKTEIEHERDEAATELRKSRISQAAALGHSMGLAARAEAAAARAEAEACRVQELQRQLAAAQTGATERHAGRTPAMSPADLLQLSVDAVNMSGANPEPYLAFLQESEASMATGRGLQAHEPAEKRGAQHASPEVLGHPRAGVNPGIGDELKWTDGEFVQRSLRQHQVSTAMTRSDLLSPSKDFRGAEGDGGAYRRQLVRADMEALGSWLAAVTDELRQERRRASTLAQRAEDRSSEGIRLRRELEAKDEEVQRLQHALHVAKLRHDREVLAGTELSLLKRDVAQLHEGLSRVASAAAATVQVKASMAESWSPPFTLRMIRSDIHTPTPPGASSSATSEAACGIGIDFEISHAFVVTVTGVLPHGPAASAGVQPGDVIMAIDSTSLMPSLRPTGTSIRALLLGPAKTTVDVTLSRPLSLPSQHHKALDDDTRRDTPPTVQANASTTKDWDSSDTHADAPPQPEHPTHHFPHFHLPHVHLPHMHLPHLHLPHPHFSKPHFSSGSFHLPHVHMPHVHLPHPHLPHLPKWPQSTTTSRAPQTDMQRGQTRQAGDSSPTSLSEDARGLEQGLEVLNRRISKLKTNGQVEQPVGASHNINTRNPGNLGHSESFEFSLTDASGKRMICSVDTEEARELWISELMAATVALERGAWHKASADGLARTHEGPVRKRGQVNTAFKSRYFVLSEGLLRYYKTKHDYMAKRAEQGTLSCHNMQVEKLDGKGSLHPPTARGHDASATGNISAGNISNYFDTLWSLHHTPLETSSESMSTRRSCSASSTGSSSSPSRTSLLSDKK